MDGSDVVVLLASLETAVLVTANIEFVNVTDMRLWKTRELVGALLVWDCAGSIRSKTGLYASQIGGVMLCAKHKKKFDRVLGLASKLVSGNRSNVDAILLCESRGDKSLLGHVDVPVSSMPFTQMSKDHQTRFRRSG